MAVSPVWRTVLITAVVALLAGTIGVYAGLVFFGASNHERHSSLDAIVHHEIGLSADQDRQIGEIEGSYAARKRSLEAEMRSATREIADAVVEDKTYSERVRRGITAFHMAMGKLQEETILHVFEMRAVLTPAQQSKFDQIVRAALLQSATDAESD